MAQNRLGADGSDGASEGWTVTRSDLDGMSLGVAVPAAVAARTDANVLEVDPLWDVVDVDALDELWAREDGKWDDGTRVTFPYMGYEVSVTPGELHLEPPARGDVAGTDGHR